MSPRGQFWLGFWKGRPPTLCPSYLGAPHGVGLLNIQESVSYLFISDICAQGSLGHLQLVFFELLVYQPGGSSPYIYQTWYWRSKDHCCSEKNCTLGINHDLGVPTKIFQCPCETFLASLGGIKVVQSQRSGLAVLGCGGSQLPLKLLIWWFDRAGKYLFPGQKHPSHLKRSLLVVMVIKWIPNSPWIRHG